ncbi:MULTISPECIES: hypothetical protein [unclassified Nonomuraea]|uniref:hypothetical protein n=1 Tax=unclassified Nonomuraea TaxID=2593643 RepID=UPI0035BF44AA
MPRLTRQCLLAGAALALAAVALPSTVAHADTFAPYARAAGYVYAGGALAHGKNIVSVSKPQAGYYCVKVSDKIDLTTAVVSVTPIDPGKMAGAYLGLSGYCSSAAQTVRVVISNPSGAKIDGAFYLFIP